MQPGHNVGGDGRPEGGGTDCAQSPNRNLIKVVPMLVLCVCNSISAALILERCQTCAVAKELCMHMRVKHASSTGM